MNPGQSSSQTHTFTTPGGSGPLGSRGTEPGFGAWIESHGGPSPAPEASQEGQDVRVAVWSSLDESGSWLN